MDVVRTRGISRRSFVAGLGALTLIREPAFARARADELDDIRIRIIDSAVDLTSRAEAIRLAGVKTVIRYYAHGPGQWDGKVLGRPELDALEAQNLSVAVVFQNDNHNPDSFLDPVKAATDAMWARAHADHIGQPEGTPIYFGIDFDLRHWDGKRSDPAITLQRADAVRRYFEHQRAELEKDGRKLGIYGCGAACEAVEGIADYFWLSASADYLRSGEYHNSGKWHLYQNRIDLTRHYGDPRPCTIDANLANPDRPGFGEWRRRGAVDRDTPDAARAVRQARAFVAVRQLGLYKDHPRRDRAPVNPETLTPSERAALRHALNVKIITEDEGCYGISLDESDFVRGYCHKSDLRVAGAMPLRAERATAPKSAALSPQAPAATYQVASDTSSAPVPLPRDNPRRPSKPD